MTQEIAEALKQHGLIAILRGHFSRDELLGVADALEQGGIRALEITLNTPNALSVISELRGQMPDMLVGAGTVRSAAQVGEACNAGAQFLIAPSLDLGSVARAKALNSLLIPGVLTPTEAQSAARAGYTLLKLFPADALGPGYLKSIRAPLDDLEFVPTGGITPENLEAYVRAGAAAFGVGSSLVMGAGQSTEELQARARDFVLALKEARG